jgi:hypothetical protein
MGAKNDDRNPPGAAYPAIIFQPFLILDARLADPPRVRRLLSERHARIALHYRGQQATRSDRTRPPHSITSSAVASSVCGTSMPSALAVFRLITNSNLVGCVTGKSAGFSPLRILPA